MPPSPLSVRYFSVRSSSVPGYDDGEGLKLELPLAQSAFSPLLSAAWLKIAPNIAPAASMRSSLTLAHGKRHECSFGLLPSFCAHVNEDRVPNSRSSISLRSSRRARCARPLRVSPRRRSPRNAYRRASARHPVHGCAELRRLRPHSHAHALVVSPKEVYLRAFMFRVERLKRWSAVAH